MSDRPIDFTAGDRVTFQGGTFSEFDADVVEVDAIAQRIYLEVPVFGGRTPVELSFEEAARILEHADQ
jgi:transcription antitermination factor NusG